MTQPTLRQQMTEVDTVNAHRLGTFTVDPYGAPADQSVHAECSCHNPDGYGEGRMDFSGGSVFEIIDQWNDHIDRVVDQAKDFARSGDAQAAGRLRRVPS